MSVPPHARESSSRYGPDERVIERNDRVLGILGPWASSFTLAWLATHRKRLRTAIFGGHKLSILVIWDTRGQEYACRSERDVEAVRQIVYGEVSDGA